EERKKDELKQVMERHRQTSHQTRKETARRKEGGEGGVPWGSRSAFSFSLRAARCFSRRSSVLSTASQASPPASCCHCHWASCAWNQSSVPTSSSLSDGGWFLLCSRSSCRKCSDSSHDCTHAKGEERRRKREGTTAATTAHTPKVRIEEEKE